MKTINKFYFIFLFINGVINAQTTVAFQGGEGTAADNWGFTPITNAGGSALAQPGAVATLPRTGTYSIRAAGGNNTTCSGGSNCITGGASSATGCSMHGTTISFNSINTSCLSGVVLTCYHRSHTLCSGSGLDGSDNVNFEVRLNGGAWTTIATAAGSADHVWTYATNPAGIGTTAPNPFVYNVPGGTTAFEFRVRGTVNRADEVFYIDDIRLTTTSTGYSFPGTSGLWGGYVSTDWFNSCNWNDRTVPTSATNVVFPSNNTGGRDIVINASTNPTCNNLILNGSGTKQVKGEGNVTKKLTINGNLTIASTDVLDFSDGTTGTPDGNIEIYGNWTNNGLESDFKEGNSTVNFLGTANQTISTADVEEAFYILNINKSSGTATLNDDVWIDKDFEGGTTPLLNFTQGKLDLNSNEIKIWNENEQAVSRASGGIISEDSDNSSKMTWFINNDVGAHVFPFIRTDNFYIPFTFNLTAGDVNDITISTYPTASNNTPYPLSPQVVSNVNDGGGSDNSGNMVNRFWQIDKTGSSGTANLIFTYGDNEWDLSEPSNYEAHRWNSGATAWQLAPGIQTQNIPVNSVSVAGVTSFSPWTLVSIPTILPIELLEFNAVYNALNRVDITWSTVSERNNNFFMVERSVNAIDFEDLKKINGAGTSLQKLDYRCVDEQPVGGICYYRLKQVDFNGKFSYSPIVSVSSDIKEEFKIYPSPTESGLLHILSGTSYPFELKLINVFGRVIYSTYSNDSSLHLDLSIFGKGVYIITISSNEGNFNKKVIYN